MVGNVRLDIFQGPLDLLLTLIECQEIDVRSIPIAEITAQYLDYLQDVKKLDLDWAGEFIVLGAELLVLKAKSLLGRPPENDEPEKEEDPTQELAARLVRYRTYKEAAAQLGKLANDGALIFGRTLDQEAVTCALEKVNPLAGVTVVDLAQALERILRRAEETAKETRGEDPQQTIKRSAYTLMGQMRRIIYCLRREEVLDLNALLSHKPTRLEIALTFLALLELACQGKVDLRQEKTFGTIKVKKL